MYRTWALIGSLLLVSVLASACSSETDETTTTSVSGLPNPASVYCQEQGGTLEIRSDEAGNQTGICVFADGSECDEWAYYRGDCAPGGGGTIGGDAGLANPASVYCQEQGGTLEIRSDEAGNQTGICVFPNGSECDEWAFYRDECSPGA